jgi:hypothetical protein
LRLFDKRDPGKGMKWLSGKNSDLSIKSDSTIRRQVIRTYILDDIKRISQSSEVALLCLCSRDK